MKRTKLTAEEKARMAEECLGPIELDDEDLMSAMGGAVAGDCCSTCNCCSCDCCTCNNCGGGVLV